MATTTKNNTVRYGKDSVRAFTFREPMQIKTHFYVPNQSGTISEERRLSEWTVNGPLKGNYRFVAEHIRCSIHFTESHSGQSVFYLTLRLIQPLKLVHLLTRFKYLNGESEWYCLPFEAYIRVHHELCDSLFQIDRANMLLDTLTQKKLQISLDFDILFYELDNEDNINLTNSGTNNLPPGFSRPISINATGDGTGVDWTMLEQLPLSSANAITDFTHDHNSMAKLKIQVEEKILYAFPEVLTLQSPVFNSMLANQHYLEAQTMTIQLPDKKFDEIHDLLKLLQPATKEKITSENAVSILTLADEYQIDHLKATAEQVLVAAVTFRSPISLSLYTCYQIANRYSCEKLERAVLEQIAGVSVAEIEKHPDFGSLTDTEKYNLLLAKMKLQEENLNNTGHSDGLQFLM